jgi:hypothetical protein
MDGFGIPDSIAISSQAICLSSSTAVAILTANVLSVDVLALPMFLVFSTVLTLNESLAPT